MNFHSIWGNPFKKENYGIENDLDFLTQIPIFDNLKKKDITKFFTLIHIRNYSDGEIVFRQDDPGVGLYIVRSGQFDVYKEFDDLTRKKIAVLKEGEFFGEISLLNESKRSATVVSFGESVLFGLFKPDLLGLMESDPRLGLSIVYRLAQVVAERLRLVNEEK